MKSAITQDVEAAMRRGPGRPRDAALDEQIIKVTLALIDAEEEVTVSRIVSHSGISRAALYRRWPSLTSLIANALDFGRVIPPDIPAVGDLREVIFEAIFGEQTTATVVGYPESRLRQRIRLTMADRELQKAYWSSHVSLRRAPIESAFRVGIKRGILRADLDVEACFDSIAGAAYYQIVVRGDCLDDPETATRLHSAFEVIWRGMLAQPANHPNERQRM